MPLSGRVQPPFRYFPDVPPPPTRRFYLPPSDTRRPPRSPPSSLSSRPRPCLRKKTQESGPLGSRVEHRIVRVPPIRVECILPRSLSLYHCYHILLSYVIPLACDLMLCSLPVSPMRCLWVPQLTHWAFAAHTPGSSYLMKTSMSFEHELLTRVPSQLGFWFVRTDWRTLSGS